MEMNYDVPVLSRPAVGIAVPSRKPRTAQTHAPLSRGVLAYAHVETARTEARENLVWMVLSIGALLLLFLSFFRN